eukprot:9937107-Ditylum_brightwellii.AAC.1
MQQRSLQGKGKTWGIRWDTLVIYRTFGLFGNGQNPEEDKGDAPAAGIQDQSRVAIKCEILHVDTNVNPRRFWAK